jgi:hypothetical protein
MCSIEEAWAGQLFEGKHVQSQGDLHRKYMPITDNLLERNNEFSIGRNEPQSRQDTRGLNTKMLRESRIPTNSNINNANGVGNNIAQVNFASPVYNGSNYAGITPRPSYMSIYDNAGTNVPMPIVTGRDNFNDINQAFTVSDTVDRFMNQGMRQDNNSGVNSNSLLNEDNDMDNMIINKKFMNSSDNYNNNLNNNNEKFNNNSINNSTNDITIEYQNTIKQIINRLDKLERELHSNKARNTYDMVLYILVGMLIAFIIYAILRK